MKKWHCFASTIDLGLFDVALKQESREKIIITSHFINLNKQLLDWQ